MTLRAFVFWLLLLSMTEMQNLHAADNKGINTGRPSLETVQQKLQLVKSLLVKSTALERASRSEVATVKLQAAAARTLYANANDALNAGDAARAEELLDQALQLIENTTRQVPDPSQAEAAQMVRYTRLLDGVHNLLATYHDLRLRLSTKTTLASLAEPENVPSLIDQAQTLARDRHYREAGEVLKSAHEEIIASLNKLLKSTTLMYDLKFKSPAEEFDYDMARYLSYEELVPIAYAEFKPGGDSFKLSERYVQESRVMKDRANQQAMSGDLRSATDTVLDAVKHLETALRIIGVVLPE
jgi:tetratricopeptide (TPR) repeat protein